MNSFDRNKLKKAGFRIFRKRDDGVDKPSIWELKDSGSWGKYEDYPSKAARDREWKTLMMSQTNIGDTE